MSAGEGPASSAASPAAASPVVASPVVASPVVATSGRGGNLVALGLGQSVRMLSGFAVNVMLMRSLGVEGFGIYGTVMNLVGLLGFGAHLGMSRLLVRQIARDPARLHERVQTGLLATALLSTLTACGMVLSALTLDGRPLVVGATVLAAVAMGLQSLAMVPEAAFHGLRQMGLSARGQVAGRLVLMLATALFLWSELGVLAVFVAQVADALVAFGLLWWAFRVGAPPPEVAAVGALPVALPVALPPRRERVRDLVREALPFGANALFGAIYLSADVLLLARLHGDAEVGVYRGAVMLISLFPVIANTLTTAIYPRLALHIGAPERAGEELGFLSRVLLALSAPAAVGGVLLVTPLMLLFGGPAFAESGLPFQILAPLLPLRFLNNGYATALTSLDRQGDRTRGVFIAALLNVGLNVLVLPRFGAVGAAATTLLTELFLTAWMGWHVRPLVSGLRLPETLLRVALPSLGMGLALSVLPPAPVLVHIAAGGALFLVLGRWSGAWRPADLRRLRRV
jgi:O-antigen/teichoic acid export membrane protein